jgi:hypothetical protein
MNSNRAEVGKPNSTAARRKRQFGWKPPGTRTAFSQGFIRVFLLVWAE